MPDGPRTPPRTPTAPAPASIPAPAQSPNTEECPRIARRSVEITNRLGLHLRPADKFVRMAHGFRCDIRVLYNGHAFNGKSILDLTSLAAEQGTRLELEADGPDAELALAALVELVEAQFHEEDEEDIAE